MPLDADTVLWAVRLHDPHDGGVRAHDVARFISKDATLSEDYTRDEVTVILESLVAEGTLTHVSTTSTEESDENASSHDATLYRFPSGPESLVREDKSVTNFAEHNGWDRRLDLGADQPREFLLESLAEDAAVRVEVKAVTAAEASLRLRIDELERERDALLAERDAWRRRAESADEEVSRSRGEGTELRQRVRELENLLGRERDLAAERLETARRAAAGLKRALEDLARLEPSAPDSRVPAHATRHKKALRGHWLE